MLRKICLCIMAFALMLSVPGYVHSDSSYLYRESGRVQPMESTDISMVDELVSIKVMDGWQIARCRFSFTNHSDKSLDVLMGFPASMKGMERDIANDFTTELQDFNVLVDGNNVEFRVEEQNPDSDNEYYNGIVNWYTWDVHFEPGKTITVENTYRSRIYSAPWERRAGYIVKTGLPWEGSIGHARIEFELLDLTPSAIESKNTLPAGYVVEGNRVIWEFDNYVPDEDIRLILVPGPGSDAGYIYRFSEGDAERLAKSEELFLQGSYDEWDEEYYRLIADGIYDDKLFYRKLNISRWRDDVEGFIEALKTEYELYNSNEIYEWAMLIYPEQVEAAGIKPVGSIPPVIARERIYKLNQDEYRVDITIRDESRDLRYISYSFPDLTDTNCTECDMIKIRGESRFDFHATGILPDAYSDFVYSFHVADSMQNTVWAFNHNENSICMAAFFNGNEFNQWKSDKRENMTFNWYDESEDIIPEAVDRIDAELNEINCW